MLTCYKNLTASPIPSQTLPPRGQNSKSSPNLKNISLGFSNSPPPQKIFQKPGHFFFNWLFFLERLIYWHLSRSVHLHISAFLLCKNTRVLAREGFALRNVPTIYFENRF